MNISTCQRICESKQLTHYHAGVMIALNTERQDRGCIFHKYDDGCFRNRRTHQKGKDAERIRSLSSYSWHDVKNGNDCHRRMESYLIYENVYFETAHLAVSFTVRHNLCIQTFHIIKRRKKEWQFLKVQV